MATVKEKAKSLIGMVKERTRVTFKFTDVIEEPTQDGTATTLRFILDEPIPEVNGRVVTSRRAQGQSVALAAFNVTYVRFNPEAIEATEKMIEAGNNPFTWTEEGKSGTFNTAELKYDVSASNLEVWVVKTSLAAAANAQRGNGLDNLAARINKFREDAKAQNAMKNQPVQGGKVNPETVGG
jgi:hypothetical protein